MYKRRYEAGEESLRSIARKENCSKSTIANRLKALGARLRPPGLPGIPTPEEKQKQQEAQNAPPRRRIIPV